MPAVRGDGMRGLAVFISDIRNCKSKEAEIKRINKELANIRSKFKGDKTLDGYQKKKYVCKLLFIFLLGHDIDFGHMEAVNLLSSNKYSEKQIGYLFISVLVNTNSELIKLIIQSIKNDLQSRNPIHVNLALQCIANIGSKEMAEAFGGEIPKLLVSGDTMDVVKQSAALCLLRLFRTSQEIIPGGEWTSRIIHLLNDQHMGVVTAATSLIDALVKKNPEEYKGCVSLAVSRLSRIVTASYTDLQDYTYYFVPAPWLSVKLLRLLQNYTPPAEDPGVRGRLNECLETILNKAQEPPKSKKVQHSNAKNAVLFEAISLIIHNDSEANLLVRACNQLGQFLSNRETNLRYLALESMCHLATSEFSHEAVKKHQELVILSMKMEKDVSVRQQAVDLLYAMCDKTNAEEIVQEMLNYLETADYSIREEMVLKVAILAEKYATDYTWYVDVILNLIRIAGDYVSEEVWYRVIQIVINRDEVQGYSAKTVFEALQAPACHENMVKVGGYILGEFGNLIAGDHRSSPAVQFQLLHSKYHLCSPMTRALLLSTYIKFINLFPEIRSQVQEVFKQHSNLRSADAELQQRASEYLQLSIIATSDVLATVLEEMPAFPERESSILAVLKKKKPGRVPENEIKEGKSPTPVANHNNEVNNTNTTASGDLLGLSTPPTSQPGSGNTGVLLDVLGDIYNKPNAMATTGNNTYNPKKESRGKFSVKITDLFQIKDLKSDRNFHTLNAGFNFLLVFSGGEAAHAVKRFTGLYTGPYFDPSTTTNITTQLGTHAYLPCKVKQLGNKSVSWIRRRDAHILTVDRFTFIADDRFQAFLVEPTDTWTLQVKYVQARDAGQYECQVSTEPKMSHFITLNVVVPKIEIMGESDIYVKTGSPVTLKCVITQSLEEPAYIFWYHDGERVLGYDPAVLDIRMERVRADTTIGTLQIHHARPEDSGNYTCSPSNLDSASVLLHVLNGEHPAAMQRGKNSASPIPGWSHLSMGLGLGACTSPRFAFAIALSVAAMAELLVT